MKQNPTRLELRNACLDAHDFISTNMNAADQECQDKYSETIAILARFSETGKLSRSKVQDGSNG